MRIIQIFFSMLLLILISQTKLNAQFGYALLFNGTSGYVAANSVSVALGGTSNITIELWCYPTAISGWRSIAAFNYTGAVNNNKNMIEYDADSKKFAYYDEVIKERYSSVYEPNAWYHVAVVITSGNCYLYVNGVNEVTFTTSERPDGTANGLFSLGQEWDNAVLSEFFAGYIDEVRLWNIARSQADIQSTMNTTLTGSEPGLVAYYQMSNGSGTTLTDNSINEHTGALIGGVSFAEPPTPLPVELTSFTASEKEGKVELNWSTSTEVNNYRFEVERKEFKIGTEWEKIGFVDGSGNSNSQNNYSFIDLNPPAANLQYRLKQIDLDGKYRYYSTIAEINFKITDIREVPVPNEFALLQNYPNPFNPSTVITYQLPFSGNITLKVYDVLGKEVAVLADEYKSSGTYKVEFNGKDLGSGVYAYRLAAVTETGEHFIISAKMMLVK